MNLWKVKLTSACRVVFGKRLCLSVLMFVYLTAHLRSIYMGLNWDQLILRISFEKKLICYVFLPQIISHKTIFVSFRVFCDRNYFSIWLSVVSYSCTTYVWAGGCSCFLTAYY